MTLTKAELVQVVVDNVGLNKREALEMVEAFFEEISTSLEAGEDVKLSGFGGFQLREKPERPGRNPKTGETARVTARRVVTFHPSQKLKLKVSEFAGKRQEPRQADNAVGGSYEVQRWRITEPV
uniref:Integration host factor subunit alpha n=1 Tax=Aromatoleum toluolicum TaxID=90060 RepID=A0ABX1NIZ3_9RHOO|nr:integration host factor subunit alpha [Aromatoleum toluolicum]